MAKTRVMSWCSAVLAACLLSACGGEATLGGGTTGGTLGGTTGGTTGGDVPGTPAVMKVTPAQDSIPADGVATVLISAVLSDSAGTGVPGRTLSFQTDAGTFSSTSASTDINGKAELSLRAPTTRGVANIIVRDAASGVTGTAIVEFVPGTPAGITVVLSPDIIAPDASSTIVASVTDSQGNPVVGQIVSFDAPTGSGGGLFSETAVTTDSNGRAETAFTADNSGTFTLRARLASGTSGTAQITVVQPGALLNLTASPDTAPADGQSPIALTATLTDFNNNPIVNRSVTFTTTAGTLLQSSALTNNGGVARVELRAPSFSGKANVTATAPSENVSAGTVVEFVAGAAASLSFSVNPTQVQPRGTASAIASVRDENGNPVAQTQVVFSVSPTTCGSFSPIQATTGTTGVASSTFTAGTTAGACTVSASGGGLNASRQIDVVIGVTGITVLSSAPTLQSSADTAGEGVTISAQVRKEGNQPVPGVTVSFSTNSGLIQPLDGGVTDESGTARATLTTGGDPTNRTVTVTARSEGSTGTVVVDVVGTKLNLDGPRSVQSGEPNTYVVTLTDAVGAPIPNRNVTITASSGTPQPSTVTTDPQGKASFTFTAITGPTVTLTANALGVFPPPSIVITVSEDSLVFVPTTNDPTPTCAAPRQIAVLGDIELNTGTPLRVLWCRGADPVVGQPVTFSTTRGRFGVAGPTSIQVTTDANGFAIVNGFQSAQSGPFTVQAVGNDPNPDPAVTGEPASTPFVTAPGEFVATDPTSVELQGDPTVIGINQQSTLQATVRDPANNLVKNATVNFSLNDVTGGFLSAGSAVTDSQGRASVVYTSSDTTSAQDGVRVTASVTQIVFNGDIRSVSPAPQDIVALTVGGQSLRIVLGTGNNIRESADTTRYELPYTAIVSDAAGNPAPGATLNLSGFAEQYGKGYYVKNDNDLWVPVYTALCANEDSNENGILDPGEDVNSNGILDPSAPVTLPSSPALDEEGVAEFDIVYPQDRGNWITVFRLRARARASGTEATETARFLLPISALDAASNGSPPGSPSPFGVVPRCDLTDDQVPTIEVRADSRQVGVAEDGGSVTLTVTASKAFTEAITIPISYTSTSSLGCAGEDFATQATVTIAANATQASFTFLGIADTDDEPDCNVNLFLGPPTTDNAIIGPNKTAVVTINDND